GGGRALLLQVAHPLVAAGVAAHSEFRAHPLRRLWRTLDLMLTLAFADGATALGAVRSIEGVHPRVHGVLEAPSGPFPRGTRCEPLHRRPASAAHARALRALVERRARDGAPRARDARAPAPAVRAAASASHATRQAGGRRSPRWASARVGGGMR